MSDFLRSIDQLPTYLTNTEKYRIFQDINKNYPDIDYYTANREDEYWQGDGWSSLEIYDFSDSALKKVSGLILSNTCDITPGNKHIFSSAVNFCTIMNINAYTTLLRSRNVNSHAIQNHIDAIKKQAVSSRFYLPPSQPKGAGYVALLDYIYTLPLDKLIENTSKKLHLRLSQTGFYVFIIKLSCHFCRMGEGIHRDQITC